MTRANTRLAALAAALATLMVCELTVRAPRADAVAAAFRTCCFHTLLRALGLSHAAA